VRSLSEHIAGQLRILILKGMQRYDNKYVADKIGLLPSGLELLKISDKWSLDKCFDIIEKLGIGYYNENTDYCVNFYVYNRDRDIESKENYE